MAPFDPISALIGGALIGFASVVLMMFNGRIAGISGILTGCFALIGADKVWRVAFIGGLIAAPVASSVVGHPLPTPLMPLSWATIVLAGFLVGLGHALAVDVPPGTASAASPVFQSARSSRRLRS